MYKEVEEKTKKICEMKERLFDILNSEMAKGYQNIDAKEAGEVVDMIKDLAETEKCCWEAHYYKTVTDAMLEVDEDPRYGEMRAGYHMNPRINRDRIDYDEWSNRLGYTKNQTGSDIRYGYSGADVRNSYSMNDSNSSRYGYTDDPNEKIMKVTESVKEMWKEADPELRKKIKHEMTSLLGEMN